MASAEDQGLGGAGVGRVEFGGQKVNQHEPDQESPEDAKVAPDMRIGVSVGNLHVHVARNSLPSCHGTSTGTDPGLANAVRVRRHDARASKLPSVELIGDKDLEAVVDGVDPPNPAEPGLHLRHRDNVACVDDQRQNQYTSQGQSLRDGLGTGGDGPEEGAHDESRQVGHDEVQEELPRFTAETSEEVDEDVEDGGSREFDRNVGNDSGSSLASRVVEGI